jgi:hypothetical protein
MACAMATMEMTSVVVSVWNSLCDVNSELDMAIRSKAVTPAMARGLLMLLEESLHQVFPLAFSDTDNGHA